VKRAVRILRIVAVALVILALAAGAGAWWMLRRALPQLDGQTALPEVKREVVVERDLWGVPRIRAQSLEDLVTAHGYVQAQDRLWQMDLLRRVAAGELSEIFGAATLDVDRGHRVLGLRQAAERAVREMPAETRALLEAYARGVNRYISERASRLPWEFLVLRYAPRPWTPADTALVGAYMHEVLSASWRSELNRAEVHKLAGEERARELYVVDSPLDRFVTGHAPAAKPESPRNSPPRSPGRIEQASAPHSLLLFHSSTLSLLHSSTPAPLYSSPPLDLLRHFEDEMNFVAGSNNWVVSGQHTYSGKPLLANDTHLPLDLPCIWHLVHLQAPGWNVKGFALPGVPLVIIGHNERIAWGFTNNGADVQDVYELALNPQNPKQYRAHGAWVDAEVRREVVRVRGRADETVEVLLTRHGPIVERKENTAYALRWTATEPGGLDYAFPLLGRAQNWQEFLDVVRQVPGPAQNAVYADVDGNIGFAVAGKVPVRKKGNGSLPVPGETDEYEWTGYVPFEEMPQVLNPPEGIIATANARVAGPGYRWHLTERWEAPYRTARIYELLSEKRRFRPHDFIGVQTDLKSLPHLNLAAELRRAFAALPAAAGDARTKELLQKLEGWSGVAVASSVETAFVEFTRRALLRNLLRPFLGERTNLYQWRRSGLFLERVLRERPAGWLPENFPGYDQLLLSSADEAAREMERESGSGDPRDWNWGRWMKLQMRHPLGRAALLDGWLGAPRAEQNGTAFTVNQTGPSFGPAMRFVADLADWDRSLMNGTFGQSGQLLSPHYRDHFPAWLEGRGLPSAFSDAEFAKVRRHTLRLLPAAAASK